MTGWVLHLLIIGTTAAGPAASTQPAAAGEQAVVAALDGYHAALAAGQPETVLEHLGPSYFMGEDKSERGPDRVSAHMYLTGEALTKWPERFLQEAGPYENRFQVISISIRGDAAVALTRETGRNKFRSWQDEEVAWFLGRDDGRWRIVGFLIRDFQAPGQTE